jgi:DNA replication protein DnaC
MIAQASKQNTPVNDGDYTKDGRLYCGSCNTPKQASIVIFGEHPMCLCRCETEKRDAEDKAIREQRELDRINRNRTRGVQDKQMHDWTFANDDGKSPALTDKAFRYCTKWEQMYMEKIGLLLWGNVGTGKTFFAGCIANALIDSGVPVLMTSFGKIINALSGFSTEDKNGYIDNFNKYGLLIIDDLGAERRTDFSQEIVYSVVDGRYKNGQPLIVTTNLTLDEIKNPQSTTQARIYDRIHEMTVPIHFTGESRRRAAFQDKLDNARSIFSE